MAPAQSSNGAPGGGLGPIAGLSWCHGGSSRCAIAAVAAAVLEGGDTAKWVCMRGRAACKHTGVYMRGLKPLLSFLLLIKQSTVADGGIGYRCGLPRESRLAGCHG